MMRMSLGFFPNPPWKIDVFPSALAPRYDATVPMYRLLVETLPVAMFASIENLMGLFGSF